MRKIDQSLPNRLIQLNGVGLLDEFSDNLSLVVLDDQNFFGTDHFLDHDNSQVGKDLVVLVLSKRVVHKKSRVRCTTTRHSSADGHEGVEIGDWKLLHFIIKLLNKLEPVI